MDEWIAVGFDGTLAECDPSYTGGIGHPLPATRHLVAAMLTDGLAVRVLTARAGDPERRAEVEAWLQRHQLGACRVTDTIDDGCRLIIDAKAARLTWNEGELCQGCAGEMLAQLKALGLKRWPPQGAAGSVMFF